ncbi:MAG: hypothetical protein IMW97_02565 [Firmicutes bacterium]|nr:hypothetical protein [Candidatus Fermentithermobacillaceae bacterium]
MAPTELRGLCAVHLQVLNKEVCKGA